MKIKSMVLSSNSVDEHNLIEMKKLTKDNETNLLTEIN